MTLLMMITYRRGDFECPWMALNTLISWLGGIGGHPIEFHHERYWVSSGMYKGNTGVGASANALDTSTLTTIGFWPQIAYSSFLRRLIETCSVYFSHCNRSLHTR